MCSVVIICFDQAECVCVRVRVCVCALKHVKETIIIVYVVLGIKINVRMTMGKHIVIIP